MNVQRKVRDYLQAQNPTLDLSSISDEDPLLEKGVIDSVAMFSLLSFLENEFNIVIADTDITPENFNSIKSIVQYIFTKSPTTPKGRGMREAR